MSNVGAHRKFVIVYFLVSNMEKQPSSIFVIVYSFFLFLDQGTKIPKKGRNEEEPPEDRSPHLTRKGRPAYPSVTPRPTNGTGEFENLSDKAEELCYSSLFLGFM